MVKKTRRSALVGSVIAAIVLSLSLTACASGQGQSSQSAAAESPSSQASSSEQSSEQLSAQASEQAPSQPSEEAPEQEASQKAPQPPTDVSGGKPWIDSNLKDNIKPGMETSPKDDFYLYVNYDWLLETDIPEGDKGVGAGLVSEGYKHAVKAVSGKDLTGHDARQAQLLYRAAKDTAARDAAGVEPAKATIDDIRALSTIDDVTAFLLDPERSAGAPSLLQIRNVSDPDDGARYVARVRLSPATFGSSMGTMGMNATMVAPEDDLYQARLACASSVLTRCGLSEDEAKAAFENRVELEKRIIQEAENAAQSDDAASESSSAEAEGDQNLRLKPEELDGFANPFPLKALSEARGYGAAKEYLIENEDEVRATCAIFTQENINLVRDYILVGYALEASGWLDSQAFEAWRQDYAALGYYDHLAQSNTTAEETAFNLARYILPTPVGRAYAEAYDLKRTKEFVEGLCKDAIESHKEIVNASEWLSDTSKKNLCEKLDAITINAVYPEAWEDYSGLDLEGLSYYDARRAIWLYDITRNAALTNGTVDNRLWRDPSLIGATGAYDGSTNSFHVAAGGVEPDVTRYEAGEMSLGELMGSSTGYLVFHEIGHSLDSIDMSIDKDGNDMEGSLLEPDDLEEFQRRVQKAQDYYDGITAYTGQNVIGEVCVNEGLTEVCAMQARLAYAAKQDNFDYKAFFENRAKMARVLRTPELEQQCILGADKHPSAYVDVNVPAQMFEEFYKTYDVKEGDGMYLAPEARIALWWVEEGVSNAS